MEIWDAYDKDLNKLGTDLIRGNAIPRGQYHIVVEVVLRYRDGSFLAMQRDWNKRGGPGLFEITAGGSILKGEAVEASAVRELQEETGIAVTELSPLYEMTSEKNQTHYFGFIAQTDAAKDSVVLQETETIDYRWITPDRIAEFIASDEVVDGTKERVWPNIQDYLNNQSMKRIMIIGSGGSGKSTLARILGAILNLPVHHLDAHMWKPYWNITTREEQKEIQKQLMVHDEWIIDGNYSGTMDVRLAQADTVIFLDISRRICAYQAIKRYLQNRHTVRPDMAEGCTEKIDLEFLSLIWNYPRDKRQAILQKLKSVARTKKVIVLKSPQQIERFIEKTTSEYQH